MPNLALCTACTVLSLAPTRLCCTAGRNLFSFLLFTVVALKEVRVFFVIISATECETLENLHTFAMGWK
jgi:hypothetical protein